MTKNIRPKVIKAKLRGVNEDFIKRLSLRNSPRRIERHFPAELLNTLGGQDFMTNHIITHQATNNYDYYHEFVKRQKFDKLKSFKKIELAIWLSIKIKADIPTLIKALSTDFFPDEITVNSVYGVLLMSKDILVDINLEYCTSHPFDIKLRELKVYVYGSMDRVRAYYKSVEQYIEKSSSWIHWWFQAGGEFKKLSVALHETPKFHASSYPFIPDIEGFLKRYNESSANVLIFLGEPGTGKTSLIRHMIHTSGRDCYTTYDDAVMKADQMFITFLDSSAKYLVLEDADLLMTDRLSDGNRVMSKILNTADGLASFRDKKLIFTANIRDVGKIDEALTRPGRCFDVVKFRGLTRSEAEVVASRNERKTPLAAGRETFTLAEVFNE